MIRCCIIGHDSYLFAGMMPYLKNTALNLMTYKNWKNNLDILLNSDVVVNFSIQPEFSSKELRENDIIDVKIAKKLRNSKARYIFISSRKVYGTSRKLKVYKETDKLNGFDFYSVNKIKTEKKLSEILKDRLCVFRISNVIGEPVLRKDYKTFVGWVTKNFIETGKVEADQSEETKKDFISKDFLHNVLSFAVKNEISGIYNVSAGFPVTIKEIVTGMVGKNNAVFGKNLKIKEQFVLDNSKIVSKTKILFRKNDIIKCLKRFRDSLTKMKKGK